MSRPRALTAADVLDPVDLDDVLLRSLLPRVDAGAVRVRVGPFWFRAVWGRRIAAVALPWGIYVRPAVMERLRDGREPRRNARLIVHELMHVEQWRRLGGPRLVARYGADYARGLLRTRSHWQAYRGVRTEIEARAAARLVVGES
jgi:hypothetical protein